MAISIWLLVILVLLLFFNTIFISKGKWYNVFLIMIILLIFFPPEINGIITGVPYSTPGYLNISLLGYDVIIAFLISVILKSKQNNMMSSKIIFSFIIFIILTLSIRFCINDFSFLSNKIFDNFCLPVFLAILFLKYLKKEDIVKLINTFIFLIFLNSIVGISEYFIGKSLFFHDYYFKTVPWYQNVYNSTLYGISFRSCSFLGHPLINGTYYLVAVILLIFSKNHSFLKKSILLMILFLAIFTTNSRSALLITFIAILYYFIKEKKYFVLFFFISLCILFSFTLSVNEIYNTIFLRDSNGSSLGVRFLALSSFFKIPFYKLLFGVGFNEALPFLKKMGFAGNFEISYLIIILENGFIVFVSWLFMIKQLCGERIKNSNVVFKSLKTCLMMLFLIFFTYNSIADPGTLNYLFFMVISVYNISKKIA